MILGRTDNNEILKSTVTAGGNYGASGLLKPEQASKFIDMITESSEFLKEITTEKKDKIEGTISKLGIGKRMFRKKIENTDVITGNEVTPIIGDVPYKTVGVSFGTEISNDFFRQNIEREGFENHFMNKIAEQSGLDVLDLAWNGDESSSDPFININNGWLKQLESKIPANQVIDAASINGGNFTDDYFYAMTKALPRMYMNQGKYKWVTSYVNQIKVMEFLKRRQTAAGDAALINGTQLNPLSIPFSVPADFNDNYILLTDPKNLVMVFTYNVGMRKTVEGKELVSKDNRFYAWFMDMDFIVLEPKACVLLKNVGEVVNPESPSVTA